MSPKNRKNISDKIMRGEYEIQLNYTYHVQFISGWFEFIWRHCLGSASDFSWEVEVELDFKVVHYGNIGIWLWSFKLGNSNFCKYVTDIIFLLKMNQFLETFHTVWNAITTRPEKSGNLVHMSFLLLQLIYERCYLENLPLRKKKILFAEFHLTA